MHSYPLRLGRFRRIEIRSHFLSATALVVSCISGYGCGGWFEEAPPLLPYYLDRQPAKAFGEIYLETSEKPPSLSPPDAKSITDLADRLATSDPAALVSRVNELLVAARVNYANGDWCNLLHDVRDVLLSGASSAAIADYIRWRVDHADWFNIQPRNPYEYPPQKKTAEGSERALELERRAIEAPKELRPHWLYLRGALGFRLGDREECQKWFDRVREEFPDSPRAEFALFMAARCELAQSYGNWWDDAPNSWNLPQEQRQKLQREVEARYQEHGRNAEALFKKYLTLYPAGRLVADTHGWLGALYYRRDNKEEALRSYIQQVRDPDHPEIKKSALFMCEDIMSSATAADDALFPLVAENPVIALGTTYLVLNQASAPSTPEDLGKSITPTTETAAAKKWRQAVLPKLAAAIATRSALYQPGTWPPRYLAMLAQAASAAGNQKDALTLSSVPVSDLEGSDDLLLARAIAFQRAGQPEQAIATYRSLLEKFPQSQLADGARLKLALALADHHEAGQAVLELRNLRDRMAQKSENYVGGVYPPSVDQLQMTDSFVSRNISGAEISQIDQILDTLYNFAPPEELAACLPGADDTLAGEVNAILAQRYLAVENLSAARKYITDPALLASVTSLEELTQAANQAKGPKAKAAAMNQLGDAWAAARGKLLRAPLDTRAGTDIFGDEREQAALRRRENGRSLGYHDIDATLEERDELRHASRWWMCAARAVPGTELAAQTRWKALAAMPQIADGSLFAFLRAVETDAAATSRQLYDRLRSECPDSIEARKYAAYWTFPLPPKSPYYEFIRFRNETGRREANAIGAMGYTALDYGAFGPDQRFSEWSSSYSAESKWKEIETRILSLKDHAADWDAARLLQEVTAIRQQAAAAYTSIDYARYLNLLDDLALFLQEPNLTPAAQTAYIELRLRFNGFLTPPGQNYIYDDEAAAGQIQYIREIVDSEALKTVPDYVDFIKAALPGKQRLTITTQAVDQDGDPVTITTRDYPAVKSNMEAFLAKYPKSAKREAALLVLARAHHWLNTPIHTTYFISDYRTARIAYWLQPFDAPALLAALDAYDTEYPRGHYASEIRDWRATAAWRLHDWPQALALTIANLDDTTHPDLKPEAALRLANIFVDLANENYRSDLIEALRQNPRAIQLLQKYLMASYLYGDHPLRYLGGYLADQLGFPFPPAPSQDSSQP